MIKAEQYYEFIKQYPYAFENPPGAGIEIVRDKEGIAQIEAAMKARMMEKGYPEEWCEVGVVFQDAYMTILRDAVLFQPENLPGAYIRSFKADNAPGVVILPLWNNKVCLLKIFRHALRRFVFEIPRGFGKKGETDEQNALRELKEEIGSSVKTLHNLGYVVENSGLGDAHAALFLAELDSIPKLYEREEGIERIITLPISEFLQMISDGVIEDSYTIVAATRAMLRGYIGK